MIKVLLVEQDHLVCSAMVESLNQRAGLFVTAVSENDGLLRGARRLCPDIVMVDTAQMGQTECLQLADRLLALFPQSKFVLLAGKMEQFTRSFQRELQRRRIMAYTDNTRDRNGLLALIDSVSDNYTTFPKAADDAGERE